MAEQILTLVLAVLASNGLFAFIQFLLDRHGKHKTSLDKGMLALLHERLYELTEIYLERGSITVAELENLKYLYEPYAAMGGNGTGKNLYERCTKLPIAAEAGDEKETPQA